MNLYVFSSTNLTNIWAGIGARRWAISEAQGKMASTATKAEQLRVGSSGVIYCVETKAITTPFIIYSKPNPSEVVRNVWPEPWVMPFHIHPLGTPNRQLPTAELKDVLPLLTTTGRKWTELLHFQPRTIFSPSKVGADDWEALITRLT